MEREVIKLSSITEDELSELSCESNTDNYEFMDGSITYYDSEKGITENSIVIKRLSDGKFFANSYTNWGQGNTDWDGNFEEVFPKTITTILYE